MLHVFSEVDSKHSEWEWNQDSVILTMYKRVLWYRGIKLKRWLRKLVKQIVCEYTW
jgi:hypothetical protein